MRYKLDEQLKQINDALTKMGVQCEECITYATQALITERKEMADLAIQLERDIDISQQDIQNLCMKVLLHQQPVARDLKIISASLKLITDMERIGDQGSDIAELTKKYEIKDVNCAIVISKMADAVIRMLMAAIKAFTECDRNLALAIDKMDDEVDSLFLQVKTNLVNLILKDKENGEQALESLMIAKYLERIGDHTVNISESVVSMLS